MVATCLTYVVGSLILDTRQGEGRVIMVLSQSHGLHVGDVPVLVAYAIGLAGCAWVAWREY